MRIAEFYDNEDFWVPLNMAELSDKEVLSLPTKIELFRSLSYEEVTKFLTGGGTLYNIYDMKQEYIIFDAKLLHRLGYTKIKFLDIAPGDTTISYILKATR